MRTTAAGLLARADDDGPAILFEDERWSYREFVAASAARAALAAELRRDGPFHVGVLLENVPEFLFWIGGAAFAGATVVGVNPTRRGAELAADIRHTDCQLIVTDGEHAGLLDGLDVGVDDDRVLRVDDPAYRERLPERAAPPDNDDHIDPHQMLLLLFTSGSTGAPKAVICSTGRLASISERSAEGFGLRSDDVFYQSMPLFHGNALMANWAPALALGAPVGLRRRFSASGFLGDVRKFGATYFNYVGRALAYILATPEQPDDADNSLRLGFGTEASAVDMERFAARFGCHILENYGSSEGPIAITKAPRTPPNALGKPREGEDVIIADAETGLECPPAEFDAAGRLVNGDAAIGEIVRRDGAKFFEGYYNNPEAVSQRLRDGWFWSGDLGYRDDDGFFYFAGRGSDWLRVDSENFAAAPIERILARLPQAVMVAVYPVPDARTGDQVMAAVELQPGVELDGHALAAFLGTQPDLGTKWAPRFVRVVEDMPLTGTNKVNKQPLRAERWQTADPVWFRPGRELNYRRLTEDDAKTIAAEFESYGRGTYLT